MIKIDLNFAIAVYLCFSISLVFVLWVFYNYYKVSVEMETSHLLQCPVCTHIFMSFEEQELYKCPQCHSYINARQIKIQTNK